MKTTLINTTIEWRIRDVIFSYLLFYIIIFLGILIQYLLKEYVGIVFLKINTEQKTIVQFVELLITLFPIWYLINKYPIIKFEDLFFFEKEKVRVLILWIIIYVGVAFVGFFNIYNKPVQQLMLVTNYRGLYLILFLFNLLVLAPYIEEIFFRGLIFKILKNRLGVPWGIIINSVLFTFGHQNWIDTFIRSLILTYIYQKSDCLLFSIMTHSSMNLVAVLITWTIFIYL